MMPTDRSRPELLPDLDRLALVDRLLGLAEHLVGTVERRVGARERLELARPLTLLDRSSASAIASRGWPCNSRSSARWACRRDARSGRAGSVVTGHAPKADRWFLAAHDRRRRCGCGRECGLRTSGPALPGRPPAALLRGEARRRPRQIGPRHPGRRRATSRPRLARGAGRRGVVAPPPERARRIAPPRRSRRSPSHDHPRAGSSAMPCRGARFEEVQREGRDLLLDGRARERSRSPRRRVRAARGGGGTAGPRTRHRGRACSGTASPPSGSPSTSPRSRSQTPASSSTSSRTAVASSAGSKLAPSTEA